MPRNRMLVWGLSNNLAGTEQVISSYARRLNNLPCDFLCYDEPLNYSDLFTEDSGNRFFTIPGKKNHLFSYTLALKHFMQEHGHEYSTLWFNTNDVSNIDLLIYAKKYGIERRITHMHNSSLPNDPISIIFSKLYWNRCQKLTTDCWACSNSAGEFLFSDRDYKIVPNRVDANKVAFNSESRNRIRSQYKLQDSFIIGTTGRLVAQKNQKFLITLLPEILQEKPNAILLILGEGQLLENLEKYAEQLSVRQKVIFAGAQKNIQGFLSAFDVFAFPSLYEGLSLSLLEAQFNGLPCVVTENIDKDSIISNNLIQIPFEDKQQWIKALIHGQRKNDNFLNQSASNYDTANIDKDIGWMFEV